MGKKGARGESRDELPRQRKQTEMMSWARGRTYALKCVTDTVSADGAIFKKCPSLLPPEPLIDWNDSGNRRASEGLGGGISSMGRGGEFGMILVVQGEGQGDTGACKGSVHILDKVPYLSIFTTCLSSSLSQICG